MGVTDWLLVASLFSLVYLPVILVIYRSRRCACSPLS